MADIQIKIFNNEILDQIAQELLCNLGIDGYNIDISTVARKLGLNVLSSSYEDNIAGYIKYEKNGEKNIYVNNTHPIVRQRFTVAHEVAHFILHRELLDLEGGTPLYRTGTSRDIIERQADALGASILMPKQAVQKLYETVKDANILARVFNVSKDAMEIRLNNLGLY